MSVPSECPVCGEVKKWTLVDKSNKGFSVGKAVTGAFVFGPIGLVGCALGKKKYCYYCGNCGFEHEY